MPFWNVDVAVEETRSTPPYKEPETYRSFHAAPNEPRSDRLFEEGVIWVEETEVRNETPETFIFPFAPIVVEADPTPSLSAPEAQRSRKARPVAPRSRIFELATKIPPPVAPPRFRLPFAPRVDEVVPTVRRRAPEAY